MYEASKVRLSQLFRGKGHGGFPAEISTHDSFCVVNSTPFPLKSFEIHVLTLKLLEIPVLTGLKLLEIHVLTLNTRSNGTKTFRIPVLTANTASVEHRLT